MRFGLSEATVAKIRGVLARFPQVDRAVLYGSRAKGTCKKGSDIDLTLEGKELDLLIVNRIRREVDELLLPYEIDLSVFDHIDNPELVEHIQRAGVLFYEKGNGDTGEGA